MVDRTKSKMAEFLMHSFLKGIMIGAGILTTTLFAAAAAMNVFSPGDTISSALINKNFAISAPEGAVLAFNLAGCPEGWTPADGTNGTPDLRGRFVRGRDDIGTGPGGNDPDGSRATGHVQADLFANHSHDVLIGNTGPGTPLTIEAGQNLIGNWTAGRIASTGGAETRPKNVALTYCMRKN